jgi:hypothetical protein
MSAQRWANMQLERNLGIDEFFDENFKGGI